MNTNRHHLLFTRREWSEDRAGRKLRTVNSLVPRVEVAVHRELHADCDPVPYLGKKAIEAITRNYDFRGLNTLDALDQLLCAINHEVYDRELADRAIYQLETQQPYLKEGIVGQRFCEAYSLATPTHQHKSNLKEIL